MSRADAVAALSGRGAGLTCGLSWLPVELLDAVAAETGYATRAEAAAVHAASVPVDLSFVAAGGPEASDTVETLHAADVAAVWTVDGVFARVARVVGWTESLRMTAADPAEFALRLGEARHDALAEVRAGFEARADAILIADDLAGPSGSFMSPDYILDALMPCYRRLALEVASGGLPAMFHSDGDIRALLPALAREGFSAVHLAGLEAGAFLESAMSARRAGLVVLGGISVQALAHGARGAGENAASVATSLGGVVICDDGGITTFEQVVALTAALDAARNALRHPRT